MLPGVPGYEVEALLGAGGFGAVVAARRIADGARVALKLAQPRSDEAQRQLAREAEALRSIGGPPAPALVEAGRLPDGTPFLAMELLELPTLAFALEAAAGPVPPAEASARGLELLEALAAVHAAGWAHGDVKPENVLLAPGAARLLDFGLAEPRGAVRAGPTGFAGTPEYMAPEQVAGLRPDARTDVYAAGVVLYELLAGRPPFHGSGAEVQEAHRTRRPRPLSELAPVPGALEVVVLRCLAKEPRDRFPDAAAARDALELAVRDLGAATWVRRPPAALAAGPVRRTVAVLFVEGGADPVALQAAVAAAGGALARSEAGRRAVVFEGIVEEPLRAALRGAKALLASGAIRRARLGLVAAAVRSGPGGPRWIAAELSRAERYPAPGDPEGILVPAGVAEALGDEPFLPVEDRPELFRLELAARAAGEITAVHRAGTAPLVERGELLEALLDLARGARRGESAVAAILAEAGHGKTRLAGALAEQLRALEPPPTVLELRGRAPAQGAEEGPLAALLRFGLDLDAAGPAPADGGKGALVRALPAEQEDGWPALALALGWLAPGAPEVRRLAAAPGAIRAVQARAAGEALRRRARERFLCVVLDDAQDAEPAALDALEVAALPEEGALLFACALGRPSFEKARPGFGERAARRRVERVGPLSRAGAAELCAWLLQPAEHVPAQAVARLVDRAGGVPLLLVELVRALRRQGVLRRLPGAGWFLAADEMDRGLELPLVEWLAERELAALPAEDAAHARLVALLGDGASLAEVAGTLSELEHAGQGRAFPLDAGAAARRLCAAGLLAAHDGRLAFRTPLLQECVARSVPREVEAAVHAAAARFYARTGVVPEALRLPRLAHHAAGAGDRDTAAAVLLDLAEDRAARQDYLGAEAFFSRYLELAPEGDAARRQAALRGRGVMRIRVGRGPDAASDLAAAAALAAGDATARAECLLDAAIAHDWMNDYPRAAALVEAAARAAPGRPAPLLAARLELGRGRSLLRAGRWTEAREALEEAARRAEALGDAGYETLEIALILLVFILPSFGLVAEAEAEAAAERAIALARERGDLPHLAAVLNNRHTLHVARGDLAAALADLDALLRIGRELGMAGIELDAAYNAGELLYHSGELGPAAARARRARELEERHPEVSPFPFGALLEARILARSGDTAAARERLEVVRRARSASAGPGPSFDVLTELIDLSSREASPADWDALVARSRVHSTGQEPIEVQELRALAAARAGRAEEARAALAEALALAGRIPNLMARRLAEAGALVDGA